jgi:branched-chain amino acid aminotransferase
MAFTLSVYPSVYVAKYSEGIWNESYEDKPHKTPDEEAGLTSEELNSLLQSRNSFPELPLVNYTTQYGLGCFEGLKAFPQPDGSLKLFRPDENAKRFFRSMEGLRMPPFPEKLFVKAIREIVTKNKSLGFAPEYESAWETDNFIAGHAVYIRPFTYSEPAIGLGLSEQPWVIIVTTPVGSYFRPGSNSAVTTERVRAVSGGTGWIKCNANYVTPILAKKEAEVEGYMEAIFLDAVEHTYIEEGSSCNIFFSMKNGTLVTPDLRDTILPGITRQSVVTLANDEGISVEERRITIDEVLDDAVEAFVTGTAAGIAYIDAITHKERTTVFSDGRIGERAQLLLTKLKGIQYGAVPDIHNWMIPVV